MTPKQTAECLKKRELLIAKATAYKAGKDGRAICRDKKSGKIRIPENLSPSNICKDGKNELLFSGIHNRTIFTGGVKSETDNLAVLRHMDSEAVDLIYLDPPFNSNRDYFAAVGTVAEELDSFFTDTFARDDRWYALQDIILNENKAIYAAIKAAEAANGKSTGSYLTFMAVRLMEMRRVLKSTGSIYLHCDSTMSHYLKMLMDGVFGQDNFVNDITWKKYRGKKVNAKLKFSTATDRLLRYAKNKKKAFFLMPFTPLDEDYVRRVYRHDDDDGKGPYRFGGRISDRKYYLANSRGIPTTDLWTDIPEINGKSAEDTGYPTQKPLALLTRIIKASSRQNDIVFDPFCGCGTSLDAAQRLGRKWIGIDAALPAGVVLIELRKKGQGSLEENRDIVNWRMIDGEEGMPMREDDGRTAIDYTPPQPSNKRDPKAMQAFKEVACENGGGVCWVCGAKGHKDHFEVDHKIPIAKNGGNERENLLLLCGTCNSSKGKKDMDEFLRYCEDNRRALSYLARQRLKEINKQGKLGS